MKWYHLAFLVIALLVVQTHSQEPVVVNFFERSLTVREGSHFNVRITKLGTNEKEITLIVQVENDEGDFVGVTQVARYEPRATGISSVTFSVKDDDIPESDEIYYLRLYTLDPFVVVGAQSELAVTIMANDDAYGIFSIDEVSPMTVTERRDRSLVQISVKRDVSFYGTVTVHFMVNSTTQEAELATDIQPVIGSVIFQPFQKTAEIQLQIQPDDIPENDESFFVTLTSASFDSKVIEEMFEVIVAANDAPVRFSQAQYRLEEGPGTKTVSVKVTRGIEPDGVSIIGPIDVEVKVDYIFESASATLGPDFSATDGTLTFAPGETSKTISFMIVDDNIPEIEEKFSIRLQYLTGDAVLITEYSVCTLIINANDNPSGIITFKPDSSGGSPTQRINEDFFTTVRFPVQRLEGTFGEVSVSWRIIREGIGSVLIAEDLGPAEGTLTFANGVNEANISLTIVQDNTPELAEMFVINLNPDSVTGEARVEGVVRAKLLLEDSDNVFGTVEFGPGTDHTLIINRSPRILQLSLTRSGGRRENLVANISVTYGDGTHDIENEDVFEELYQAVTLPDGEDPVLVNFELLPSAFLVVGGTFRATIAGLTFNYEPRFGAYNGPRLGVRQEVIVPVTQTEANGETGFFNVTSQTVDEPDSGVTQVGLLVSREGLSGRATIRWSLSGDDVTAGDVVAMRGTLTLESGISETVLEIGILADDEPELTELITVSLESIQPSDTQRLRPGSTSIVITVNSNDNPGGVLQFSPNTNLTFETTEGGIPVEFTVERTGGALEERSVLYTVEPNEASQFYGATNVLVFPPNKREVTGRVLAIKDGIPEESQAYTLVLTPIGNPPPVLGERTTITITVASSDSPNGVIQFATNPTTVYTDEGQLGQQVNVTLTVQRTMGTFGRVTVPWSITPNPQDDLSPSSGVIEFQPGQAEQEIMILVNNDDLPEEDETFALQLANPEGGALPGIPMVATIIIRENDSPVEFTEPLRFVSEPQTINLVIRRQGKLDKQTKVHYRTLDGSASSIDGDYVQIQTQELVFAARERDKIVQVSILNDDVPEGNETFSVQLFDVGGDLITTNSSTATIVITANDQAYGVFSFAQPADATVEEGDTIFFDIVRNRGNFGTVRVHWELRTLNSVLVEPGKDFEVNQGQVDFSPQENRRPLAVTPLADNEPEVGEQYLLVLTSVEVLDGMSDGSLVALASPDLLVATVRVHSSDDPNGRMAFAANARELMVAEDFYSGNEESTKATFIVERRQGTQDQIKVLWEIFSDQLGGNMPPVHDLLFTGQWPNTVTQVPDKQRPGTKTSVALLSGAAGQYITVPAGEWPELSLASGGFSLSAWVQPFAGTDGYIVVHSADTGDTHYLSLRLTVTDTSTILTLRISTESQTNRDMNAQSSLAIGDGKWHHVFVALDNSSVAFYIDGQLIETRNDVSGPLLTNSGVVYIGAQPPGSDLYSGYLQDVRLLLRALDASSVNELYEMTPNEDVTPISGTLTYNAGSRTQSFTISSRQDIEEEGREVFAVILLDTTGGAALSATDSRTTLSVLKSDNANGLFGFDGDCSPSRVLYENSTITCTVQRTRGDDGTVSLTWMVKQRQAGGAVEDAIADFDESSGTVVFLPGERSKTFEIPVKDESTPELDEVFEVQITSVVSDDGLVGSTNISGASIDSTKQASQIVVQENDYPYGLLQFSDKTGELPEPGVMIQPVDAVVRIVVSEEGGLIPLVVQRAQGTLGAVRAEWRTKDITALSEGKSPPDYVGGAGSVSLRPGENFAFVNITVKDNSLPEAEKHFEVELFNPTGGAALGPGAKAIVIISASDGAFGVFQFADDSLTVLGSEDGEEGFNTINLQVVRLAGSISTAEVRWKVEEDETDGQDIVNHSGTLSFLPGETLKQLELRVRGDTEPELDEEIRVTLTQAVGGELGDPLKRLATVTIAANDDPYGRFVIKSSLRPEVVAETEQDVTVTVERLGGKYGSVEVDFSTLDPTETYPFLPGQVQRAQTDDFDPAQGTLNFEANQELAQFRVHIKDDETPEQDESVFVILKEVRLIQRAQQRDVPSSPRLGMESETYGQIIISSNDEANGVLQLSPSSLTVEESERTPEVYVVRSGGSFGEVSVAFRVTGDTADKDDYRTLSSWVFLADRETRKRVPLEIRDDLDPELQETFTIELLRFIIGGAELGDQTSTVVTILPSDDPNGVFEFLSDGQTVEEGSQAYTVSITVTRTVGAMGVVSVGWQATLNGQSAADDISPTSGFLYFVTNDASRKINITILPDNVPEGFENISITLVNVTNGGRIGDKNTFILSILPNDSPHGTVQLSSAVFFVPENPVDGPQTAQVVRSGGSYGRLKVYYTTAMITLVDMVAANDGNVLDLYVEPIIGYLAQAESEVDVSNSNDTLQTCASACLLQSSCRSFYHRKTERRAYCMWYTTIYASGFIQPGISGSYYSKNATKISAMTIDQAKSGEDFLAVTRASVVMEDGRASAAIPFAIVNDQNPELDERFFLWLVDIEVEGGSMSTLDKPVLGELQRAVVTITTNDNAMGAFQIYSSSEGVDAREVRVRETDRLAVDLVVERIGGDIGTVSVQWIVSTVNRTATYGQDYIADGAILSFGVQETRRIITLTILDDEVPENDEGLTVVLTDPAGGATLSTRDSIRVIILANDFVAGVLSFEQTSILAKEGDQIEVKIRRSSPAQGTVTATWIIQGRNGLASGEGFQQYTGTLTFLPSQTEMSLSLNVLSDDTPEVDEEYTLTLIDISTQGVGATGAASLDPQQGTVLITIEGSNDPHGVLQFAPTSLDITVEENVGTANLQVDRKFGAIGVVRVSYEIIQGSLKPIGSRRNLASAGQDFFEVSQGFINVADGITSGIVSVTIVNDGIPEIDEVFLVRLTGVTLVDSTNSAVAPRLADNGTETEIIIRANDGAQGIIQFASDSRSVSVSEQGQTISLAVVRGNGTFGQVSVFAYSQTVTQSTVQGQDFNMSADTLVFEEGESSKSIEIFIADDDEPEPAETFEVILANPSNGAVLGQEIRASVTILHNDMAAGVITFDTSDFITLREPTPDDPSGSKADILLRRGPGSFGAITVGYAIQTPEDELTNDVSPPTGTINFSDRQTTAVITVETVDDITPEVEETFTLKLEAPSGGAVLGSISTKTIIISPSDAPYGLVQIFTANSRLSNYTVEENFGILEFDVVRTQGMQGRVTVDVMTVPGTATASVDTSRIVLAPITTALGASVSGWCQVTVGDSTFLVMLTSLTAETQLASLLTPGSRVGVGQSVLYRWQGDLTYVATFSTDGATACTSFDIDGSTYLVVANSGREGKRQVSSIVYRVSQQGQMEVIQGLSTSGASDVEYIKHNLQHFVFFTNTLDDKSRSDISSLLFEWNPETARFSTSPKQLLSTLYARAVTSFMIDNQTYVAVANYYDRHQGSYQISSTVYRMDSDFTLVLHQQLAAEGAISLTHTEAGGMHLLVVANNRQDIIATPQDSTVYRWDPLTRAYVLHQTLKTSRAQRVTSVITDSGTALLMFANQVGNSEIFVWDIESSQYKTAWTGVPYLSLQPVTVHQTSNTLNMLVSAGIKRQEQPALFQIAHVAEGSDFVPRRITMTFEANQTLLHTSAVILTDEIPEEAEGFSVSLTSPSGGAELGQAASVNVNILSNDDAYGIIEFAQKSLDLIVEEKENEDTTAQLNVHRREGYFGHVTVAWQADGDHSGIGDITPLSGQVEFANGQAVATIVLTVRDDQEAEFAEVTFVRLTRVIDSGTSSDSRGAKLGDNIVAKLTVLANDSPYGVVSWEQTAVTVSEPVNTDQSVQLTVVRKQGLERAIRVSYVTSAATELPALEQATSGEDFVSTQGSIVLEEGVAKGVVLVVIKQDNIPEAAESFLVNLTSVTFKDSTPDSASAAPSIAVGQGVVQVTITENDNARGIVELDVKTNNEGRFDVYEEYGRNVTIELPLTRLVGLFGSVTVTWQATSLETDIRDFSPSSGTVQFDDQQKNGSIFITIIDDTLPEDMETFDVKLITVTGDATLGQTGSVRVAILKNDSPAGLFRFATSQVETYESRNTTDPNGAARVVVQRVQDNQGLVNVQWRLNAEASVDFLPPLEGTIQFIQGEIEKAIVVQTRPDTVLEGREEFVLSLVSADNNADISHTAADCRIIILPDPGSSGTVSILPESRNLVVSEPGEPDASYSGEVEIKLTRGQGKFGEIVVTWSLTPRDLSAFQQVEGSLKFLDLQQTASIILQTKDDSVAELRETFTLQINSASGGAVVSTVQGEYTSLIVFAASDYPHGLIQFAPPELVTVSEDSNTVRLTVKRNKGLNGQLRVAYNSSAGNATMNQDFIPIAGTLTFQAGIDSQSLEVAILPDDISEGPEYFFINLISVELMNDNNDYSLVNGLSRDMQPGLGTLTTKIVRIDKNDNAEGIIQFSQESYEVKEEQGQAQITVIRSQGQYGLVTVRYRTDMITATEGVDYVPASGELIIPEGTEQTSINITLKDDSEMEQSETLKIVLSNVTGGASLGVTSTATITILKSDYPNGRFAIQGPLELNLENPEQQTRERLIIERTGGMLGQQQVFWRLMGPNNPDLLLEDTTDISVLVDDGEVTFGSFTWEDGEAGTRQLILDIKPYTSWEVAKSFVLELYRVTGTPPGIGDGEVDEEQGKAVIKVARFGDPNGIVQFTGAATQERQVLEPNGVSPTSLSFPLSRGTGTGVTGNIQIFWEVRPTNLNDADVRPSEGSVILEEGQRSGEISLQIMPDDIPELTETFTLALIRVEGGAQIASQHNQSVFSIRYNDNPHGEFGIIPEYQAIEVNRADLTRHIRLNFTRFQGSAGSVILTFTISYDFSDTGVGLEVNTGTVTFGDGDKQAITLITITGKGFLQLGSTFTVRITDVQFLGAEVTEEPKIRAGFSQAKVGVPAIAANTELSFSSDLALVNEDDQTMTVTLARSGTYGRLEADWVAGYSAVDKSRENVVDGEISPSQGTVMMIHGQETANLTVQVTPQVGRAEAFVLRLPRSPETLASGGARLASSRLSVQADPSGLIRFSEASLTAQASELEGQVTLTIWRLYGSERQVKIYYQTLPGDNAQQGLDFESVRDEFVLMDPFQTTANINIQIYQDNRPEQTETFYVNLTKVERFPTPTQPILSPRVSHLKSLSTVTIKESNDPYGILSLSPTQRNIKEAHVDVQLTIRRTGGLFGAASCTIRTVGGGESWTSQIVPQSDSLSNDTIADVLGKRTKNETATGGSDYEVLNQVVNFKANENEKQVSVTILEDDTPEPRESVLIYLTQSTGARIAQGASDGGLKGYAVISIAPNDLSNGLIGFTETSKNIEVDEDASPRVTLELIRLNAFFGEVKVNWKAKKSLTSTDTEDAELTSQLQTIAGFATCPPETSRCSLYVDLINDDIPEESYTFVVVLTSAETDAQLIPASLVASVRIKPSDDVRGLIQFASRFRVVIVGENDKGVRLEVERIKGRSYEVTVNYTTIVLSNTVPINGIDFYPALDTQDFRGQTGTLIFQANTQDRKYIDINLTPVLASDNPLPKQFYVRLSTPTGGARVNPDAGQAAVRIVKEEDIAIWQVVSNGTLSDDDKIKQVISKLNDLADKRLSEDNMKVIEDVLDKVNKEGDKRRFPKDVVTVVSDLYCNLLDSAMDDARKGHTPMAQVLENFAYTLVTATPCLPQDFDLETFDCENLKISAGRWPSTQLAGYKFDVQTGDTFTVTKPLPTLDEAADGTADGCVDFGLLEYRRQTWFDTDSPDDDLMQNRVIGFSIKGRQSARIQAPVKYRIHTPEGRIAGRGAECVYFDEGTKKWVSPTDVCKVTNDLGRGRDEFVDCECSHMSSYAVIATTRDDDIIGYVVWFYVVCFICMGAILLAVMVHHLCFSNATFSASIYMHFLMSVFFTQMCLVIDAYLSPDEILAFNTSEDNSKCIAMGLFLHYFFLAQFSWIATQSVNLWKILILNDEHTDRHYIVFFIIGWGVPLILVAMFYAVTFNIYKYHTDNDVDFIYGNVNNNGEICFITNEYAALGGILLPVLVSLLVMGIVFVKAYQLASQWHYYDDVYRSRLNSKEIPLILLVWGVLLLTCLWLALHMIYGYLWMMVLFCIFNLILALLVFVLYAVIRNPLFSCIFGPVKASYSVTDDLGAFPLPQPYYQEYATSASVKGSRTSLINDAWESSTYDGKSRMTVKRTLPSQVYINPPVAVISPAATIDSDNPDFDDLIYALKMGGSRTPSELSRSMDDDLSQLSIVLDRYETKRVDIADTHL